jgi:hypothetical protein
MGKPRPTLSLASLELREARLQSREKRLMNKQDTETFERLTNSLELILNAMDASTEMVLILHKEVQQLKAKVAYLMGDTYQ